MADSNLCSKSLLTPSSWAHGHLARDNLSPPFLQLVWPCDHVLASGMWMERMCVISPSSTQKEIADSGRPHFLLSASGIMVMAAIQLQQSLQRWHSNKTKNKGLWVTQARKLPYQPRPVKLFHDRQIKFCVICSIVFRGYINFSFTWTNLYILKSPMNLSSCLKSSCMNCCIKASF